MSVIYMYICTYTCIIVTFIYIQDMCNVHICMCIYIYIFIVCIYGRWASNRERFDALDDLPGRQWHDVPQRRCPAGGLRERHRWSGRSIGEFGACRGAMWGFEENFVEGFLEVLLGLLLVFRCSLDISLEILNVLIVLLWYVHNPFVVYFFVGFAGAETLGYKKTHFSCSWRSFHYLKEHHASWPPWQLLLRFAVLRTWRMHVGHVQSVFGQSMRHFSQHRTDIEFSQLDRVG